MIIVKVIKIKKMKFNYKMEVKIQIMKKII